jgi:hypothetical protein
VHVPVSQQPQQSHASHTLQVGSTATSPAAAGARAMAAQSIIAIMGNLLENVEETE